MKVGFKTGPSTFEEGRRIVEEEGADLCEIWFNVTELEPYDEVLDWLASKEVAMGLHHWGLVDGKYKTNLMAADEHVRNVSIEQMKQTIDIAAEIGAVYVNVHPGARMIEEINFDTATQRVIDDLPVSEPAEARDFLLSAVAELHTYARRKGLTFTTETLPAREAVKYKESVNLYDSGGASLSDLEAIATQEGFIANDFEHTATHAALIDNDPTAMWRHVKEFTEKVRSQTKLLHIATTLPPYEGTDSHGGFRDEDFTTDRFPSREQLLEWLRLFKDRSDVFVIPEPHTDMQGNYKALKQLVSEV